MSGNSQYDQNIREIHERWKKFITSRDNSVVYMEGVFPNPDYAGTYHEQDKTDQSEEHSETLNMLRDNRKKTVNRLYFRVDSEFLDMYEDNPEEFKLSQNQPLWFEMFIEDEGSIPYIHEYIKRILSDLFIRDPVEQTMMVFTRNTVLMTEIPSEVPGKHDDMIISLQGKYLFVFPFIGIEYLKTILTIDSEETESPIKSIILNNQDLTLIRPEDRLIYYAEDKEITEYPDFREQLLYILNIQRITVCAYDVKRITEKLLDIIKHHLKNDQELAIEVVKALTNTYNTEDVVEIMNSLEDPPEWMDDQWIDDQIIDGMVNNHLTWRTILYHTERLEPQRFKEWKDRWMRESIIFSHSDYASISQLFFKMFPETFRTCVVGRSRKWYYYSDGMWNVDEDTIHMMNLMNTKFYDYIKYTLIPDYRSRGYSEKIINGLEDILKSLRKPTYKNNLVKEAIHYYHDSKLQERFDSNVYLLNTMNCLMDFSYNNKDNYKLFIRDPKPEDYITKRIPVRYNTKFHWNHPRIKMIKEFMSKLFTDPDTLRSACIVFSSFLVGGNKDKKLYIMSGPKDSGKSTFKSIFIDTILNNEPNGYARDAPVEILVRSNKNSGQASPELAQAKNSKILTFTEPEKNVTLEGSTIKRITGGDSFFGRALYENGGTIRATFKIVMQCNTIPLLRIYDIPALERFFIIPFNSVFKKDAPEDPEEQMNSRVFPLDDTIRDNTGKYAEALFWYICQYIPVYFKEGIRESEEMKNSLKNYLDRNDVFAAFLMSGNIEKDDESVLTSDELFTSYRIWFKYQYGNELQSTVNKLEIFDEIVSRLGVSRNSIISRSNYRELIGYRLSSVPQ
jgi:phage/plasmid-associated DNA primase